jgi:hypothetical protein
MCTARQAMCTMVNVEFRVHRHEGVDLSADHPTFFKVAVRIFVLTNFFAQIPNSSFHCPLCVTGKWTCADGFGGDMSEEMDAVANKMNPRCFALVVKRLETPDKILEGCVAVLKVLWSDNGTLEYLNPSNQFAVVFPVGLWKDVSQ